MSMSLKRATPEGGALAGPAKIVKTASGGVPAKPKVAINKTPGAKQVAGSSPSQASIGRQTAKRPSAAPPPELSLAASAPPTKSSSSSATAEDGSPAAVLIRGLVSAVQASSGEAKLRDVNRLADALGQTLQIEHLSHFLRSLKRTLVERGKREGVPIAVRSPSGATPAGSASSTAPARSAVKTPPPLAAISKATPESAESPPTAKTAIAKTGIAQTAPQAPSVAPLGSATGPVPKSIDAPAPREQASDSLHELIGELAQDPVFQDGSILQARLIEVLTRLWDGCATKISDWPIAWKALAVPVENQVTVLQKLLNIAFMRVEELDKAPAIVAELVKTHRVQLRSVEEVLVAFGHNLDGVLAMSEEAWQIYSKLFVNIFPKPTGAGWGWSRVGWSWSAWWQFVEKSVATMDPSKAFEVVANVLQLIQEEEECSLAQIPSWIEGDKLQRVLTKMSELGSCEENEVVLALNVLGVNTEVA